MAVILINYTRSIRCIILAYIILYCTLRLCRCTMARQANNELGPGTLRCCHGIPMGMNENNLLQCV